MSTCTYTCDSTVCTNPLAAPEEQPPSLTVSLNSAGDRTPHEPYAPFSWQYRSTRHASGTIRASHSIAVRLRPANAASLRWRAVRWLGSSTMPLASCCGARTSCARPDAVKEWRRKLQQVECATGTTTPRASNAIEHGSLPYALREKNFAALSRTLGFCDLGDHTVIAASPPRPSRHNAPVARSPSLLCSWNQ